MTSPEQLSLSLERPEPLIEAARAAAKAAHCPEPYPRPLVVELYRALAELSRFQPENELDAKEKSELRSILLGYLQWPLFTGSEQEP